VTAPFEISFDVACSAEHAFTVWALLPHYLSTNANIANIAKGEA